MTTQTVGSVVTSGMPSVNLLPPEIAAAAKFRRLQAGMAALVVAAAGVVGLMYVGAHHSVASAQQNLSVAQAHKGSLQTQVNALQSVAGVYTQVSSEKALETEALGSEVRWSYQLEDLSLRIPSSVWLTQFTVAPAASAASATGTTTPTAIQPADTIATIDVSGDALSRDDVAKWLSAIAAEHGWSDPFVSSITETPIGVTNVYTWSGTIYVTSTALSGRYVQTGTDQ